MYYIIEQGNDDCLLEEDHKWIDKSETEKICVICGQIEIKQVNGGNV